MAFESYLLEVQTFEESFNRFKDMIKAKTLYTLEERWGFYLKIRTYLPVSRWYMSFKSLEKIKPISWYDDFYLDRYAVMRLGADFVQRSSEKFPGLDVDELKEEILQSGYSAFENDW